MPHQLAQVNMATTRYPLGSTQMKEFVDALEGGSTSAAFASIDPFPAPEI